MGRITVGTATVNGVRGVSIFVPAADVVANAERHHDIRVTDAFAFCKAFARELAREDLPTDDGDVQSLLAEAFQEALDNAVRDECRGFINGEEVRSKRDAYQDMVNYINAHTQRTFGVPRALLEYKPGLND